MLSPRCHLIGMSCKYFHIHFIVEKGRQQILVNQRFSKMQKAWIFHNLVVIKENMAGGFIEKCSNRIDGSIVIIYEGTSLIHQCWWISGIHILLRLNIFYTYLSCGCKHTHTVAMNNTRILIPNRAMKMYWKDGIKIRIYFNKFTQDELQIF